jgi:hypothetical protein
MPAPARCTILVAAGLLVASVLALPGSASADDADAPALPPPAYAVQARAEGGDRGNRGYHYAAAHTQTLATQAKGLRATLSVHHPRQVRSGSGQHSLGQIAVGQRADGSYLEAGWRQHVGKPRLFVYWRPADGGETCYNFGCGFRPRGRGLRPGAALRPGSEISVAFQHLGNKWWLKVNGTKSGFYPDRLWSGRFTGTDFAQLYGEVYTAPRQRVCADMGNGMRAHNPRAAYMKEARWLGGPALRLHQARSVVEVHGYTYVQTSRNSFRYGGPGEC